MSLLVLSLLTGLHLFTTHILSYLNFSPYHTALPEWVNTQRKYKLVSVFISRKIQPFKFESQNCGFSALNTEPSILTGIFEFTTVKIIIKKLFKSCCCIETPDKFHSLLSFLFALFLKHSFSHFTSYVSDFCTGFCLGFVGYFPPSNF